MNNWFANLTLTRSSMQIPETTFLNQYSEIVVEFGKSYVMRINKLIFDMADKIQNREERIKKNIQVTFYRNNENSGRYVVPEIQDETRLQELSLKKNKYFGAIHFGIRFLEKIFHPN